MPPKTKSILFDIVHAGLGIMTFVDGKTLADYQNDLMLRSAVERQFTIIGEAMTRLRKHEPSLIARISEFEGVIRFRNVLVHGYDQIDDDTTWKIIQEKLPILVREVESLMGA
jgi:uncharacterized protein with HEPN domain